MKEDQKIITRDWMAQRIVLEILMNRCPDITIKLAKSIARDVSAQVSNAFYEINNGGLAITDGQAVSEMFWIRSILNAGKDFNQKTS